MTIYENSKQLNISQLQYNYQNLADIYPQAAVFFSEDVLQDVDFGLFIHFFKEENIDELTIVPANTDYQSFILKMSLKELRLTTKSSIKKVTYQFNLSTLSLRLNDRQVDHSFYDNFLKKIDHVSGLLLQDMAVAYGV